MLHYRSLLSRSLWLAAGPGALVAWLLLPGGQPVAAPQPPGAGPAPVLPDSLDEYPGGIVLPMGSWSIERATLPADRGVVYGRCRQRLGFSSGGFGQYVRLYNLDTHKFVRLLVKPVMRSARESTFCFALPPGRYALQHYEFTQSKAYGGQMTVEPLRKPGQLPAGASLAASRYTFRVVPGALHYVGSWLFDTPQQPRFEDTKRHTDSLLTIDHTQLPLATARLAVPQ